MDKQGWQVHEGPIQNVPRWLSLSQVFLSLHSKQKTISIDIQGKQAVQWTENDLTPVYPSDLRAGGDL